MDISRRYTFCNTLDSRICLYCPRGYISWEVQKKYPYDPSCVIRGNIRSQLGHSFDIHPITFYAVSSIKWMWQCLTPIPQAVLANPLGERTDRSQISNQRITCSEREQTGSARKDYDKKVIRSDKNEMRSSCLRCPRLCLRVLRM